MQAGPQEEAKLFISKGDIRAFEQHLANASPTGAEQYVDLLEAIEIAPNLGPTEKECLFQSLFRDLECRQQAAPNVPPVKPSDAKAAALFNKGLDGDAGAASPVVNASVSIFHVFRGCLQKDRHAGASAPRLADRIWEQQARKGPYLLERGAIYNCAFYGNSCILKKALDVLDNLERTEPETKRLLYYNSCDEEKETPLEFALMHGDTACVEALGRFSLEKQGNRKWHMFADKAARRYMGIPVLHCALAFARQVIVRPDGNPELAKNRAIILLEKVIDMLPDTLCQLKEVPEDSKTVQQTPLSNAREIADGDLQWELPAKMIRSKIFEVFVGDPNSARRALYSPHGKLVDSPVAQFAS
jgi:ankyrin repeat protein